MLVETQFGWLRLLLLLSWWILIRVGWMMKYSSVAQKRGRSLINWLWKVRGGAWPWIRWRMVSGSVLSQSFCMLEACCGCSSIYFNWSWTSAGRAKRLGEYAQACWDASSRCYTAWTGHAALSDFRAPWIACMQNSTELFPLYSAVAFVSCI